MPTQLSMFGAPPQTGASIFDPVGSPIPKVGGPAQRSAAVFMQHMPREFALPSSVGPRAQMSMDFGKAAPWSAAAGRPLSVGRKALMGARRGVMDVVSPFGRKLPGLGLALEAGLAVGTVAGGIAAGAAQWGSPTGLEEDYVGGAIYGGITGTGQAAGGFGGLLAGAAAGGAIGSILPGAGTLIGGIVGTGIAIAGAIAGQIAGENIGLGLTKGIGRQVGMGARSIIRTARAIDRVQFGGNFVDSRAAYTMRQRAVQDMAGSMLNARQFLGNEAIFLHER